MCILASGAKLDEIFLHGNTIRQIYGRYNMLLMCNLKGNQAEGASRGLSIGMTSTIYTQQFAVVTAVRFLILVC